jgi:hypothetical protein
MYHHYVAQQFKGRLVVKFTPVGRRYRTVRWDISGASLGRHTTRAYQSGRYVYAATQRNLVITNARERRHYHVPAVFLARGPIRIAYTKDHVAHILQRPRHITNLCDRLGARHHRGAGTALGALRSRLPVSPTSAVMLHPLTNTSLANTPPVEQSQKDDAHWVFYQWSSIAGWATPNRLAQVSDGGWVAWYYWSADPGYRSWQVEYTALGSDNVTALLNDVGCIDFGATLYWPGGSYKSWYPYGDNNVWYSDCGGGVGSGPSVLFWPGNGFTTPLAASDFAYEPSSLALSMAVTSDAWGATRDNSNQWIAVPSANY